MKLEMERTERHRERVEKERHSLVGDERHNDVEEYLEAHRGVAW
jgi:hypothetical protein